MAVNFTFIGQSVPAEILNVDFDKMRKGINIAGNTFCTAILEGIAENNCYISNWTNIQLDGKSSFSQKYNGVDYRFFKRGSNLKRNIVGFFRYFAQVKELSYTCKKGNDKGIAFIDILMSFPVFGALLACKLYGVKSMALITDVPGHRARGKQGISIDRLADFMGKKLLDKFDLYVLLSEEMRNVIGNKTAPYIVVEGLYDEKKDDNPSELKLIPLIDDFVVIYAGTLHYQYGIMNLVNAVTGLDIPGIKLLAFGEGNAKEEIINLSRENPRIGYGGVIPRETLLVYEQKASLMANPRPIEDDYVKYSFPSKNLEYMASGTPTLLTDIPSLPEEYKKYVFLAKDNSVQELQKQILAAYEMYKNDNKKYNEMGQDARAFILNNKNKKIQTKKIIDFAEECLRKPSK